MSIRIDGTNTTANPGITGGDADTGLQFGTDEVSIVTGGTEHVNVNANGDVDLGGLTVSGSATDGSVNIDSSGRLLVGTSTARANFFNNATSFESEVQVEGTDYNTSSLSITTNQNNTNPSWFVLGKTRGTSVGGNTVVQNNDGIGGISFQGSDGSELVEAARIQVEVDGTPGANDMPGRLVFSTTADGASSPTERMRLASNGRLYVQGAYDNASGAATANLQVSSNGEFIRASSSIKYKTDVEPIEYSYSERLLDCRPVWYRSNVDFDNPNHSWWGFIAEEVAEIDPRLVHWKTVEITYDENGSPVETPCEPEPEGVSYERFVPHLLNLIKRQKEQIETQGAAIAALEAKVAALEATP